MLDIKPLGAAPYGVASRFEQGLKGPGGRLAGDYEITELRPNELLRFRVLAGPARPTGLYRFQPRDGGTELTFVLDYQAKGLSRLMEPLVQRSMEQEVGMLDELKAFLEQHA